MNIKNFVYFAIFILVLTHINNSYCPIFGPVGFREKIKIYNNLLISLDDDLKEYDEISYSILINLFETLNYLKSAGDELSNSTPAIIFFKKNKFLPDHLEIKEDSESIKKIVKEVLIKFIDNKIKELNDKVRKVADKQLKPDLTIVLQKLQKQGIDVPTVESIMTDISQLIAGKNIIEWIDYLLATESQTSEQEKLNIPQDWIEEKLDNVITTIFEEEDKYLKDILDSQRESLIAALAKPETAKIGTTGKTLIELAKDGTTSTSKNILNFLKIKLDLTIRRHVLRQFKDIFKKMEALRESAILLNTPVKDEWKTDIVSFVKNYNSQKFGPPGQEKTLLDWVNQDDKLKTTTLRPLLELKARIG